MKSTCKANTCEAARALILCAGMLLLAVVGCGKAHGPPRELLGTWQASGNVAYEGSSFEVTPSTIIFRRGEGYQDRNALLDVTAKPANDKVAYDIRYRNFAGGEQTLSLFYFPGNPESLIRFKYQQDVVWRPVKSDGRSR